MNESRYVGSVVGLAVGDALGYPAEFRRRDQLLAEIGPRGITDFLALQDPRFSRPFFFTDGPPPGSYTDDTQMSIAVAEALLAAGQGDLDQLMGEMGRRFVAWSRSDSNNRAPGETCMRGCDNLAAGAAWREAGVESSKGCGSAMRVAPIGLFFQDLDRIVEVARASSLLTHGHCSALASAAAAALMVALALDDAGPARIFDEIDARCGPMADDFARTWRKLPGLLSQPPENVLVEQALGEGWVAEEAVASAMYCVCRAPDDFEAAVLTAVNTDGDSDSIAAITGSVSGARLGADAIPAKWRDHVEDSAYLHELGRRLYQNRCITSGLDLV